MRDTPNGRFSWVFIFLVSVSQILAQLKSSLMPEFNEDRLASIVRSVYTALQRDTTATAVN